jgi:tRNA (adenine57-N1/adenine58-N1)-methyltransferase
MIAAGARVLLVDPGGKKYLLKAARGMIEVAGLGVVSGDAICDSSFGARIMVGGREFIIATPSAKDILGMIERRAQVIIPKDSFVIPLHLDLGCGGTVIEGGLGSGALTLVLLKAVAPKGKVYSYETREDFASLAKRNISLSENASCWELRIADICVAELEAGVDAVMLDIPNPWDAVDNAVSALRHGGHLGCYVPNANQLENAVKKMRSSGLSEVVAFETIQREMVVHEGGVRPSFDMLGHTGYLAFGRKL